MGAMHRAICLSILLVTLSTACSGGLTTMSPVVVRTPSHAPSEAVFARLVRAAEERGYEPNPVQPRRSRFAVRARYAEGTDSYLFAVERLANGRVTITPIGRRVELFEGNYILPVPLRHELYELARALERANARAGLDGPTSRTILPVCEASG